jgi:Bacterial RNA polymerase, alpha chain C terminal domain
MTNDTTTTRDQDEPDAADRPSHALTVREHWDDDEWPWPLERLREILGLSDQLPDGRWQTCEARVADVRALIDYLDNLGDEALERVVEQMMSEARLQDMSIRDGSFHMAMTHARTMASAYVAMARTMLGDAENYSETPFEFDVKIAESPERYTLVVQRYRGKTPHQLRRQAEVERDEALARLERAVSALPIEYLELDSRPYNALKRSGYHTVGEVPTDARDIGDIRNFGVHSVRNVLERMAALRKEYGLPAPAGGDDPR